MNLKIISLFVCTYPLPLGDLAGLNPPLLLLFTPLTFKLLLLLLLLSVEAALLPLLK